MHCTGKRAACAKLNKSRMEDHVCSTLSLCRGVKSHATNTAQNGGISRSSGFAFHTKCDCGELTHDGKCVNIADV